MRATVIAAAALAAITFGAADAQAVITVPIPSGAPDGPPPIPALPAASAAAPPADQIADPITPAAACGDWHQQNKYGDRWPAGSSWWEYRCSYEETFYDNPCTSGACDAFCWYCTWRTQHWTDYFYWDGSNAVFYGEAYSDSLVSEGDLFPPYSSTAWWDAPAAQWYQLGRPSLTVSKAGSGSGLVGSSPGGISCGDTCQASFDAGTEVTLTATPDASSIFTRWSGDCSGTGSCQVTMDQARSVAATFAPKPPPPNDPPTASFTVGCVALSCGLDGGTSADPDGTIVEYHWDFGDNTTGAGKTTQHSYAQTGTYTVTLTVTDDRGASDTSSQAIAPIAGLTARGYKLKGLQHVDLVWSGGGGGSYAVYRDGAKIVTVQASSYTDNLNRKGTGTYSYKVCQTGGSMCSNQATVTF
jgi:hypothetical protein